MSCMSPTSSTSLPERLPDEGQPGMRESARPSLTTTHLVFCLCSACWQTLPLWTFLCVKVEHKWAGEAVSVGIEEADVPMC